MRKILIDTDTGSDDAMAIVMALRDPSIEVVAITTVAGNVDLELATANAKISVEKAQTYQPPIYKGVPTPLFRQIFRAEDIHGSDGMGENFYPVPDIPVEKEHAVNAILDYAAKYDDLEIVALGPLTNLALAFVKDPETMKRIKRIVLMGSQGLGFGNSTPMAEFNIYADAEACQIILECGLPVTLVGWDACLGDAVLEHEEILELENSGSVPAHFSIECNATLRAFNVERLGRDCMDLADPSAMAAALYPECIRTEIPAYAVVETKSEGTYGEVIIDQKGILGKPHNVTFVTELDGPEFKNYIRKVLM